MKSYDKISERLSHIDQTLSAQHVTLQEHIRRTELLEAALRPVERHVAMVSGALKFIGLLGILAGIFSAIYMAVQ